MIFSIEQALTNSDVNPLAPCNIYQTTDNYCHFKDITLFYYFRDPIKLNIMIFFSGWQRRSWPHLDALS